MQKEKGKIHIYAGDGKGKSTASVGLAVRAAGNNFKVLYTQFLKDGTSSEFNVLRRIPEIEIFQGPVIKKFIFAMNEEEKSETHQACSDYFSAIVDKVKSGNYDLLIMDEIIGSMSVGMVSEDSVIAFLKGKPTDLEVVMTGREPSREIVDLADYYSEIIARKHPYETEKLQARKGIEF